MDVKINIQDLSELLFRRCDISRKDSELFVRQFFETISTFIVRDKIVKIKGLGTFKLVEVSDRESVDVNTGQRILINGHSKVSFTPDTTLRDQVNKPFIDFETVILNDETDIKEMEKFDTPSVTVSVDVEEDTPIIEESQENVSTTTLEPEESVTENLVLEEENVPSIVEVEERAEVVVKKETPTEIQPEPQNESKQEVISHEENVILPEIETKEQKPEIVRPSGTDSKDSSHLCQTFFKYAAVLLLVVGSYFAGYYRLFSPELKSPVESINHETQAVVENVPSLENEVHNDSLAPTPIEEVETIKSEEHKTENPSEVDVAEQYPQIPGGKYLIVGTKATHEMGVGDNLYKIARNTYGSNEMVQYIIVYNQFKNPDVIPPGYLIKLPELKEVK